MIKKSNYGSIHKRVKNFARLETGFTSGWVWPGEGLFRAGVVSKKPFNGCCSGKSDQSDGLRPGKRSRSD